MEKIELIDELSQNFIDFSHEANCQRAFADARDGLKPGQRACLWEMYSKGYTSNKPHVKSAKISGGTIATWWPHGDQAIYDTFARMSQPWINNIPEVDWHGANGSIQISGEPASARYTEARLSKATEEGLLTNIKKNNVPMKPNFSEDDEWPVVFPALLPRLMINGCQGIGSTIANVWLPHSLIDFSKVIINYITNGELDYSNLYPSFPTGGVIINKREISKIYETGKGKVTLRSKATIDGNKILITEIPYQTYVEPLIKEIKELAIKEEIPYINNVLNKSDKKKLLIEIECEKEAAKVLNLLYKNTNLQKSYSANQYALVGKTPKLLTLKEYIDIYLNHNYECIKREYNYDLEKAKNRLEIVSGLIRALEDIDNVIALIKASASATKAADNLKEKYKFTERQAKAIVDMKLGRLAHLEKISLNEEKEALTSTILKCEEIIGSVAKQKEIYLERFSTYVAKYGDARKTELTQIDEPKDETTLVEPEKCVVVMTENGNIKRIPTTAFKLQKKNTKGVKTKDDISSMVIRTNTVDSLMVFSDKGKMYRLLVDNIPSGTNATKGVPVTTLIEMENNEKPTIIYSIYKDTTAKYVLFATKKGLLKKTSLNEYIETKRKTGIGAITLKDGDELVSASLIDGEQLIVVTKNGQCIRFDSKEISATGRMTSGVKGINLAENDEVVAVLPCRDQTDELALFTPDGVAKKIPMSELTLQKRGGKGLNCFKNNEVVCASLFSTEDELLIVGITNSLCIKASDITSGSRASGGSKVFKGRISGVCKI